MQSGRYLSTFCRNLPPSSGYTSSFLQVWLFLGPEDHNYFIPSLLVQKLSTPCSCPASFPVLMMEAVGSSKMLTNMYSTTECHIPENSNLYGMTAPNIENMSNEPSGSIKSREFLDSKSTEVELKKAVHVLD